MSKNIDFGHNYYMFSLELKLNLFTKEQIYKFISSLDGVGQLSIDSITEDKNSLKISNVNKKRKLSTQVAVVGEKEFKFGVGDKESFGNFVKLRTQMLTKSNALLKGIKQSHIFMIDSKYYIDIPESKLVKKYWESFLILDNLKKTFKAYNKTKLAKYTYQFSDNKNEHIISFSITNTTHEKDNYVRFTFGLPNFCADTKKNLRSIITNHNKMTDDCFQKFHKDILSPLIIAE